ncbi:MAG: flagellar protein FlgN [Nitrospiraceae bacterium]|nr:flagellar protein FlgN [Nitrospiraceae bacterium]
MTPVEAIRNVLNEQISSCKVLLGILQRERACLVELNAVGVEEISKEKDTVILRMRLLEEERIRLVKKCFQRELTLKEISTVTGDATLLDIRSTLLSLAQSVEELNQFNKVLIDRSLSYVRSGAGFFGYHGFGQDSSVKGHLISAEI